MVIDIFLATLVLWLMFIPTANIVNRYRDNRPEGIEKLAWLWVAIFLFVDVVYNYTYGALLFMEFASNERKTFTARLKYYLRTEPDSWRGKLSYFFCTRLIEPFDPMHCGLK